MSTWTFVQHFSGLSFVLFSMQECAWRSRVGLLESFPIPSDHRKTTATQACAFGRLQGGVMSYAVLKKKKSYA